MKFFFKDPTVYIMANHYRTVFYVGVTGYPWFRIPLHRRGVGSIFASSYRCRELVYYERHPTMKIAIRREKRLKRWRRAWKLRLIQKMNPKLRDLYDDLMAEEKVP